MTRRWSPVGGRNNLRPVMKLDETFRFEVEDRMRIARVIGFAACLALGTAACSDEAGNGDGDGAAVDSAAMLRTAAAAIEPGMSQDDVRNRLGEPRTRVTMDGGYERWTYYNYDAQGQIAARTLIIFGNDGKVAEVNDL